MRETILSAGRGCTGGTSGLAEALQTETGLALVILSLEECDKFWLLFSKICIAMVKLLTYRL